MDPRVNALWWDILGDGVHWTNGSRTTIGAFNITSFELIRRPVAKVIQMCGHDSTYVPRNPFPSFFLHSFIPLVCEKDFSFASQLISPYPTFPSCRHFIIPILSFSISPFLFFSLCSHHHFLVASSCYFIHHGREYRDFFFSYIHQQTNFESYKHIIINNNIQPACQ